MTRPIRRTQAIAPFGVGAMVDFPGPVSLIHAGLDAWPYKESNPDHREFRVEDEKRLAHRLGVDYFVQPPDFRYVEHGQDAAQINLELKLPFLRFPLWHVCPRCGRMWKARYHDRGSPECRGPVGSGGRRGIDHPKRKTVQVRFVSACKHGHLQDFPWLQWLFKNPSPDWHPDGQNMWLRMRSTGSASLGGVEVAAEEHLPNGNINVIQKRTLAGAFEGDPNSDSPSALSRLGIMCGGHNPALGIGPDTDGELPGCGQHLYPLLRGASNLYFPQVVSSIYIPEINDSGIADDVLELLDDYHVKRSLLDKAQESDNGLVTAKSAKNTLRMFHPESSVDPEKLADAANKHLLRDILLDDRTVRTFLSMKVKVSLDKKLTLDMIKKAIETHFPDWTVDPSILLGPLTSKLEGQEEVTNKQAEDARQDTLTESGFRNEEYQVLCRDIHEGYPKTNLLIRSTIIENYGPAVRDYFERISLLHKLRETRAFVGFSRIFPENDLPMDERRRLISIEPKRWLPAIVVRGEGIFLKFSDAQINQWVRKHDNKHTLRLSLINHNLERLRARRHQSPIEVTPKFILLHTFAHLIINQLVYDCGYGSASLRERIYSAERNGSMSGILIYTAAGDSEGTMGGLVRMGQPGYLEDVIFKAIARARWCSTDPVCIESPGQGPDNCNLAACHACVLLPETSCEEQNRLLDRGVIVGTIENPNCGFFSEMI